jgi:hypothetical protein
MPEDRNEQGQSDEHRRDDEHRPDDRPPHEPPGQVIRPRKPHGAY